MIIWFQLAAMGWFPLTRSGCPGPHPAWPHPASPPGLGRLQLLWAAVPAPHQPLSIEFPPNF